MRGGGWNWNILWRGDRGADKSKPKQVPGRNIWCGRFCFHFRTSLQVHSALEHLCIGAHVHWCISAFVHWCTAYWNTQHWNTCALVHLWSPYPEDLMCEWVGLEEKPPANGMDKCTNVQTWAGVAKCQNSPPVYPWTNTCDVWQGHAQSHMQSYSCTYT